MDRQPKIERLRSMMRPYESSRHVVVAFRTQHGSPEFIHSGAVPSNVACQDAIFEIGSVTKLFTAILLCRLVEENKVDPLAPLRDMCAELADVPDWITPRALVSHTSGLPRIHVPIWRALIRPLPADPYADFGRSDLLAWFRTRRGKLRRPKQRHAYSNLGFGLLGEAMAMMERRSYIALLTEKVIAPLGLKDTTEHLSRAQQHRFAPPRTTKGSPVPAWTFDAMAGAGCLRSTASDLARFCARCLKALADPASALDRAIQRSAAPIFGLGPRGAMETKAQCHGWFSQKADPKGPWILHHDGGTAGSTCAIYLCPEHARALAILSNNGVAANLWAGARLSWSAPIRHAHSLFASP